MRFSDDDYVPKPKLKKIERKLVPVLEKLSVEELMETNTYQRFNQSIEKVFENVEDMDLSLDIGEWMTIFIKEGFGRKICYKGIYEMERAY